MDLEMILNELSMRPPAPNIQVAIERMRELTSVMASAVRAGVKPILRTSEDFRSTPLARNYLLAQWLNDPAADRDAKVFFLRMQTKAPFLIDFADPDVEEKMGRSEFRYQNQVVIGLGVAFFTDSLAISLMSDKRWDQSNLLIEMTTISDEEELLSETSRIIHASNHSHISEHQNWIQDRIRSGVSSGAELWNRRDELFPFLVFTDNVRKQLHGLRPGDPILNQTLKRLLELNHYASQWREGPFDPTALPSKVSPESDPTLRQYGDERSFLCPDRVVRLFSLHMRLTPGAWRLHFFPDTERLTLIIGYIGPKLPTISDPT